MLRYIIMHLYFNLYSIARRRGQYLLRDNRFLNVYRGYLQNGALSDIYHMTVTLSDYPLTHAPSTNKHISHLVVKRIH